MDMNSHCCPHQLAPACSHSTLDGGRSPLVEGTGRMNLVTTRQHGTLLGDQKDIAIQSAQDVKSINPRSLVKLKDLQTGDETVVALKAKASDRVRASPVRHIERGDLIPTFSLENWFGGVDDPHLLFPENF